MTNDVLILYSVGTLVVGAYIIRKIFFEKLSKFIALAAVILGTIGITILTYRYFENIEINFISLVFKSWNVFLVDSYAIIMALTSTIVGLLIVIYSFGYMEYYERQKEYYFYVTLFIGAMLGLIFSGNLILMYIFWEITSICSWQLISFYRKNIHVSAGTKAFLVTFLGSALMLVGIAMIYKEYGTFNLPELKGKQISDLVAFLLLSGMIAKSSQIPFHMWLPEAGVAPTPVTALLHAAILVKIGVYTFGRIFDFTFNVFPEIQIIEIIVAVITILLAGFMALVETDIKKILAYSTISQLGYIFLGLAVNVRVSILGAIFYIVSHAVAKAGLFLSAGIVEHNTKERNIFKLGGLSKTMPFTSVSFLLCGFTVIGLPPFSGFWGKLFIIKGMLEKGYITYSVLVMLGSVLTLMYIIRIYNYVFLGEKKFEIKEATKGMVVVVVILALVSVLTGVYPNIILNFIKF